MLYGTGDPVGGSSLWTRVMATMADRRLSLLNGAGHMVWLDEPNRVGKEIREFLGPPMP
jgi:pimeloyl-ACP methyl ester carboxylesterase